VSRAEPGGELRGWLTVPQILEDLQVSAEEWHAWRAAGETPAHAAMPDGTLRVNAAEYDFWLTERTTDLAEALDQAGVPRVLQPDVSRSVQARASRSQRPVGARHLTIVPREENSVEC
jgi:hypothetical protein